MRIIFIVLPMLLGIAAAAQGRSVAQPPASASATAQTETQEAPTPPVFVEKTDDAGVAKRVDKPVIVTPLDKPVAKPVEPPVDPKAKAADKAPPAPARQPKRRAVQQNVEGMPAAPAPLTYGAPAQVPTQVPTPPTNPPPARVNSCDAGGCTDTGGQRYNGGVGTTVISPQGKLCNNNGVTVQCF